MPTYEYRCNACGKNFEYQQRMSDDDLVTCEACGQPKLEKLISGGGGFVLKGTGWYRDLYASPPSPPTESSKAPEAKAEGKSESKSEPKSDSGSSGTSEWSDTRTVGSTSGSSSGGTSGGGSGGAGGGSGGGSSGGSGGSSTSARSE